MEHRRACWCVDISARMHTEYKYHIWTLILSLISDTKLACGPDKVWYSCLVWQFGAFAGSSWSSYRCGLMVSPLFPAIRLTHTHTHTGPKVFTALFFYHLTDCSWSCWTVGAINLCFGKRKEVSAGRTIVYQHTLTHVGISIFVRTIT